MKYIIEKNSFNVSLFVYTYSRKINLNSFLSFFGVKKCTYFGYFFSRLYNALFCRALDLEKEYNKYYKKEYPEYSDYLSKKYNLSEEEIKDLRQGKIFYLKCDSSSDSIVNTLCDDDYFEQFQKYMEAVYENQD